MTDQLICYRCGQSLTALTLPLSRRDECPNCGVELHVCRMCHFYNPHLPDACAEDDALQVKEKARANFCDYFKPSDTVYSSTEMDADLAARESLGALFEEAATIASELPSETHDQASPSDDALKIAESIFKK